MRLTISEKKIIKAIIENNEHEYSNIELIDQLDDLRVSSRENTGAGLYVNFYIKNKHLYTTNDSNLMLGGLHANISTLNHGAQFILYIQNGLITMLECACYDEKLPEDFVVEELFDVQNDGTLIPHL